MCLRLALTLDQITAVHRHVYSSLRSTSVMSDQQHTSPHLHDVIARLHLCLCTVLCSVLFCATSYKQQMSKADIAASSGKTPNDEAKAKCEGEGAEVEVAEDATAEAFTVSSLQLAGFMQSLSHL